MPVDAADVEAVTQGDFGEYWLHAVAAGCGFDHGTPATVDLQKADVQLTMRGTVAGISDPTVQVQVRSTVNLDVRADGNAAFDVDVATYEALRNPNRTVRRVLMVVGLERDGDRVRLTANGTLLVGRAAWVSLEGLPATGNVTTVRVSVPLANTVDCPGLMRLLELHGIPRSTRVAEVTPWLT